MLTESQLVESGLSRTEAQIILTLARGNELPTAALARSLYLTEEDCSLLLLNLEERGILSSRKTSSGTVYALSDFLASHIARGKGGKSIAFSQDMFYLMRKSLPHTTRLKRE